MSFCFGSSGGWERNIHILVLSVFLMYFSKLAVTTNTRCDPSSWFASLGVELSSIAIMMNTSRILSELTILSRGRATATKDNRRNHPIEKGKTWRE